MRRWSAVLAVVLTLAVAAPVAEANTCQSGSSPFTDVPDGDAFCTDVLWLRNANVTLGCAPNLYCPSEAVTRLQMALFMKRLAFATQAKILQTLGNAAPSGTLESGAVLCTSNAISPQAGQDNERQYHGAATLSIFANALADVRMRITSSTNGGAFNQVVGSQETFVTARANEWTALATQFKGGNFLEPGNDYIFRIELRRQLGSSSTGQITDAQCTLRIESTEYAEGA